MRYSLLTLIVLVTFVRTSSAQDSWDEQWYKNCGLSFGWNASQPTYPALNAYAMRFDNETAFANTPMLLNANANGFSAAFYHLRGAHVCGL